MQQLVKNEAPFLRHLLAHIAAGILARQRLRQCAQHFKRPLQGHVCQLARLAHGAELLARVVYERAEASAAFLAYLALKKSAYLFKDNPGAVVQYVPHRPVFPVQVAYEMLGTHRQSQYSAKIDYLRARGCLVRVLFR